MKTIKYIVITGLLPLFSLLLSCKNSQNSKELEPGTNEYSKFFTIEEDGDFPTLSITEAWNNKNTVKSYRLIPRDHDGISSGYDPECIPFPLQRIICMSTSHIAYLDALGADSLIKGVSGSRYINNEKILNGIKTGKIIDVGYEASLDYEIVKSLNPDVVFAYGIQGSDNTYLEKLKRYGIRVISLPDFLEEHPLGKLEYIKIFGYLTGEKELADSIFNERAEIYNTLCEKVNSLDNRSLIPVIVNTPWKDTWYIPGKQSNFSHMLYDAGGYIVGAKEGEINASPHSVEEAYMLCMKAEYWLNPGSISSTQELISINPLFTSVPPIKNNNIYNNTLRSSPGGGNDFFESGVVEPHLILEDLIRILHPGLLPDGEMHYYIKVES